jgi:cell division protein FtsZ
VRVSVVATGIDQAAINQIEPVNVLMRPEPPSRTRAPNTGRVATQPSAYEAGAAMVNDVHLQPVAPVAVAFPDPIEARRAPQEEEMDDFIPPEPEQPMVRAPRMPQIEDLPQVAQNQLRAAREGQSMPENRRKSLLEKLAAFGITRHDEEAAPRPAPAAPPAQPRTYATPVAQPDFNRGQARPLPPRAPAAPAASLDAHGRPAHRPPVTEDDQLDIPAFLRRQQT